MNIFETELLGPNGFPRELEEDPDQDGYFRVEQVYNFATRALEIEQERQTKHEPGVSYRIVYDRKEANYGEPFSDD